MTYLRGLLPMTSPNNPDAWRLQREIAAKRRRVVIEMRIAGATLKQIGLKLGISPQAVSNILNYNPYTVWGIRKPGWHWAVFREIDEAIDRTFPAGL